LSRQDLRRILLAKSRLSVKWWEFVALSPELGFNKDHVCAISLTKEREAKKGGSPTFSQDELEPLAKVLERGSNDPLLYLVRGAKETRRRNVCPTCVGSYEKLCNTHAKKMFDGLVLTFDIGRKIKKLPVVKLPKGTTSTDANGSSS